MRRLALLCSVTVLGLVTSACATGGAGEGLAAGSDARPSGVQHNVIGISQILKMPETTAYQLIRRVRPFFLRTRGVNSVYMQNANRIAVFLDGTHIGDVRELSTIQSRDIWEIRYLSPSEAVVLHGRDFSAGIIDVTSRR